MTLVRVCFVIDELATAGTETQLLALIHHLDRSRFQPYLVLLRGDSAKSQALEPQDCPVIRLGVRSLLSLTAGKQAIRFLHFLWREQINVVQVYFPDSSYFAIPVAWWAGVRHRLRTRNNIGHWMTATHRLLGRILNRFTSGTIANCHAAREALLREEHPRPESVVVLENGVDLDRFNCVPPLANPLTRIGTVANLRPVKGLDLLLEAASQLRSEFPKVQYRIAGEGSERAQLEAIIRERGLEDCVQLLGQVSDIPGFLAGIDLAVLCSRAEGMSNALLEYMAAGRAIVATAVGAAEELIRDGVDGLLVPPNDVSALTNAIRAILQRPEQGRKLGESARARVRSRYSRLAMVRRFEEFYTKLAQHDIEKIHAT